MGLCVKARNLTFLTAINLRAQALGLFCHLFIRITIFRTLWASVGVEQSMGTHI